MNKKRRILALIALFCLIRVWFMPQRERTAAETHARQQDALTHDIAAVAAYQSPYIGDAVNATHLFDALPLGDIAKKYHINSAQCTLTVHYQDALERHDAQEIRRGSCLDSESLRAHAGMGGRRIFLFPRAAQSNSGRTAALAAR